MVMLALQMTFEWRCCNDSRSRGAGALQRESRLELDCQGGNLLQPRMQSKHKGARRHAGWLRDKATSVSIGWQNITAFLIPGLTKHQ